MIGPIVSALLLMVTVTAANAQWHTSNSGGDFDDEPTYVAVTASEAGMYGFGLRCKGKKIAAVFITPDKSFNETGTNTINAAKPELRIKIDNGSVKSFETELSHTDQGARATSEVDLEFLSQVRAAKSRISVVLTILGDNFHETRFAAKGSTPAMDTLVKGCGLPQ